ncbi:reverse transcriptase domain-containing protein, partial [Tanacetum coccineum]
HPLLVSSPPPASPIRSLGYRVAMIRLRAEAPSTSHSLPLPPPIIVSHTRSDAPSLGTPPLLPIPLPTSLPPLHLLSTDHRADRPEVTLPPRKRLGIALGLRYEVEESSSAPIARPPGGFRADYGFDEMLVDMPGAPTTDDTELGRRMTEFTTRVRQDTYEIYTRLDDEQTERHLIAGRLNMLYRDRRAHAYTARLMEAEARMSREAWGQSIDTSNLACAEVMSLRTQVVVQQAVITELQAADRKRQATITEMLTAYHKRQAQFIDTLKQLKRLQTQMTEFERQHGPAKGPAQPDALEEAELALLCGRMFPEESDKIEKYVGGLPDMIHGSVVASKPKTMQDAVEITTKLMDKKILTFDERQTKSKRKFEDTSRNTQNQQQQQQEQQQNKRQNTGRAYTAGTSEKKPYGGSKPLCAKCKYHHDGPCAPKCQKCNKFGHFARDCRSDGNANNVNNQ